MMNYNGTCTFIDIKYIRDEFIHKRNLIWTKNGWLVFEMQSAINFEIKGWKNIRYTMEN